jgi:hypothetical protein
MFTNDKPCYLVLTSRVLNEECDLIDCIKVEINVIVADDYSYVVEKRPDNIFTKGSDKFK